MCQEVSQISLAFMPSRMHRAVALHGPARLVCALLLVCAVIAAGCTAGVFKKQYEYEEELYLNLDGSATLNLNASVAALVALHGMDLPLDPRQRLDRQQVRALFEPPGTKAAVSLARRDGRRFVHVSIDVDDVRQLARIRPFAWSTYRFDRRDDVLEYKQVVGPAAAKEVENVGWDGTELVAFRMHLPSEILFNNAPGSVIQRGNILEWEQPLADRLHGTPLQIEAHIATESILRTTLLLFGSTVVAAGISFAIVVWWVARRGRGADVVESHP
jgi:hypothetical protein